MATVTSTQGFKTRPLRSKQGLLKIVQLLLMLTAFVLLLLHLRRSSVYYDRDGILDKWTGPKRLPREDIAGSYIRKTEDVCVLEFTYDDGMKEDKVLPRYTFLDKDDGEIPISENFTGGITRIYTTINYKNSPKKQIDDSRPCSTDFYGQNVASVNYEMQNNAEAGNREVSTKPPTKPPTQTTSPDSPTTMNPTVSGGNLSNFTIPKRAQSVRDITDKTYVFVAPASAFNNNKYWTAMVRGVEFYWAVVIAAILSLMTFLMLYASSTTGWILITRTTALELIYNFIMALFMLMASSVAFFFVVMSPSTDRVTFMLPLFASILGLITGALYIVGAGFAHKDFRANPHVPPTHGSSSSSHHNMQSANLANV